MDKNREVNSSYSLSFVQTDATTPNIVGSNNVESCCVRVGSGEQKDATMLGPALHRGKETTHKTLETMFNARAPSQQCWKSCANESNIVVPRFGDHGTKEMLGVVGTKV